MPEEFLDRTEPPSPRKLAEVKKKGVAAKSRDLTTAALLLSGSVIFYFFFHQISSELKEMTIGILSHLNTPYDDLSVISYWLMRGIWRLMALLSWPLMALVVIAILLNVLQVGFLFSTYPLKPRWSNINIFYAPNYRKYFTQRVLVRVLLDLTKIFLVLWICWKIVKNDMLSIINLSQTTILEVETYFFNMVFVIALCLSGIYFLLGLIDLGYQKWLFFQEMKMSPSEIKEEAKQMESSIQWKAKILALRARTIKNRIEITVPQAQIVLTGLPHYAIALQYNPTHMDAPICVALGANNKAMAIRNTALRHRVPIVEEGPLTQSLFQVMKEGHPIPPSFYHPVAVVLTNATRK